MGGGTRWCFDLQLPCHESLNNLRLTVVDLLGGGFGARQHQISEAEVLADLPLENGSCHSSEDQLVMRGV